MFQCEKMADKDMLCWQLSVIRFLVKEEVPTSNIHAWLHRVYGDVCMGTSSVRWWVKHSEGRNTDIANQPLCGFLQTACTRNSKRETDDLVGENWLVTVREMAAETGITYHVVQKMVQSLGNLKDCACYISHLLMEEHKLQWKNVSLWFVEQYAVEGDNFVYSIHFDLERKWQSMEWHHKHHARKRSQNNALSP